MNIIQTGSECIGIKLAVFDPDDNTREVGRAFLYIMHNDLHDDPFGLLEDVFVEESERGNGLGTKLVKKIIALAQEKGCYKLIATSRYVRPKVHELYMTLGFDDHGKEFRINF